jgi:hypothetical protein
MENTMNASNHLKTQHTEGNILPVMPTELAATWGCFLHEGLISSSLPEDRESQILESWGMGCLELMTHVSHYLPLIWAELYLRHGLNKERSGVFEYDVVSVLGEYLGDYLLENEGELPSLDKVRLVIHYLIRDFFHCSKTKTIQTSSMTAKTSAQSETKGSTHDHCH